MQTKPLTRDRAYVRILRATNALDETVQLDGLADSNLSKSFLTASEHELLAEAVRILRRVESEIERGL